MIYPSHERSTYRKGGEDNEKHSRGLRINGLHKVRIGCDFALYLLYPIDRVSHAHDNFPRSTAAASATLVGSRPYRCQPGATQGDE